MKLLNWSSKTYNAMSILQHLIPSRLNIDKTNIVADSENLNLTEFDLRKKLISVQHFTTDALFSWNVGEGMNDSKKHELFIHQGGLTLPSRQAGHSVVNIVF